MDTTLQIIQPNILGPRRRFVPQMCFVCGSYDFSTIDLETDFPSWVYNVCSEGFCKQHASELIKDSIYRDEMVFQDRGSMITCKVKRSSGEIDSGWTIHGLLLERDGKHKVIVTKNMMQKILQIEVVYSLNEDIHQQLDKYIENVQNSLAKAFKQLE